MIFLSGDLLRRGLNQNEVPIKQVFAYAEHYEDYLKMDNPLVGEDD